MPESILQIINLKKVIGDRTIISDVSLELKPAEIFGFLGPNGAGKTTTIKMIVGLSKMTEGTIMIGGHSVAKDFKSAMKNIGCIVENPDMYKYMSGMDNLRIFSMMYRNVDKKRIDEVVEIADLAWAINDKVATYSLGMKQRLGIAQALLHRPRVLVLDEPTNGLDPAGIKELRELLRQLSTESKLTTFVSSHILAEMQQMCDRIGIINEGKMITVKTVGELVNLQNGDKINLLFQTDNDLGAASLLSSMDINNSSNGNGLNVETTRDRIPSIITALTYANIAIYAMDRKETQSLEDVFMVLTGKGK